ncbi:hypothetical protein GF314_04760 [bacterium]|nr:hypothetical protein [bacterium]
MRRLNQHRSRAAGAAAVVLAAGCLAAWTAPAAPEPAVVDSLAAPVAGPETEREIFLLEAGRAPLLLARGGIVAESFRLRVGGALWQPGRDYRLRSRSGMVVPLRPWAGEGTVVAEAGYRFRPGLDRPRIGWRRRAPAPARDQSGQPAETPALGDRWDLEQIGDLDVRGSKSVYVSSGTNRELTVDQNLRLNVSGQLTRDIFVRATLTDDNLPVVPEGNTEELQDIDKVLVELQAPRWAATLGDFVATRDGTRFGGYRRKLQGMSVVARPGPAELSALFGSPRGRYRTVEFRGEESNQGPYPLASGDTGRNLFVVAGSERVTVDGERLTRGQDRDYVIDYVRGTITFTYRRLITAESLITVEFEEGEGPYARSVVGGGAGGRLAVGEVPVRVQARITRESDDPGRLRTGTLEEEDEAILAAAGDDPLAAVAPGAVQVEPGEGDYVQVGGGDEQHFEFAESGGDWTVEFYYAGPGLGAYDLEALTETGARVYVWRGPGEGSYGVGRLLPLPTSQSLATLSADVGDTAGFWLHGEWHASSLDRNVLSDLDSGDDGGTAGQVALRTGDVGLAGGDLRLRGSLEARDARFAPFTATRTRHDYEGWGLGDRASREGFLDDRDQELEAGLGWRTGEVGRRLDLDLAAGRLEHGSSLTADRATAEGLWELAGGRGRHRWREATSSDDEDPLDILRREQDHDLRWRVGPVVPRGGYRARSWIDDAAGGDAARGYRLEEITAGVGSPAGAAWRWEGSFTRGIADSLRAARWEHERDSRTWRGAVTTPRVVGMRLVADATVREVQLPAGQEETTRLARLDLAGTWSDVGSDWSLGYAVDNSRTEVLARQIVFVGVGEGRYDQAGNFVGEGRGDYDVLLAGTDSLVATTAVKADLEWRQDMTVFGARRPWTAWSSQTRIAVEGRSRTDDVGGLLALDPGVIFDPETTVLGRIDLTEELTLLRHLRAWDLRWRFDYDQVRDRQYAQGQEDRLRRDHLVTLTWNPLTELSLRVRGGQTDERRETDAELNPTQRGYDVLSRRGEGAATWRPTRDARIVLGLEAIAREDAVSGVVQDELALAPSARWQVRENWSLQADLRLSDVTSEEPPGAQRPYFFPPPGTNVESSSRLAWEPSRFLSFALAWFGRKPGGQEWQHDLRLESTARF